eukprot:TRINITY_DN37122_c0_g1_i2.p1 TRINITY_DN37122_c0_g1~~TRINITY_DN37122_c0_g1_i2.p1  ORF type:complete len:189 (+),score=15.14 TRINITY_DN37122_c0_g1_i2:95-661(+)
MTFWLVIGVVSWLAALPEASASSGGTAREQSGDKSTCEDGRAHEDASCSISSTLAQKIGEDAPDITSVIVDTADSEDWLCYQGSFAYLERCIMPSPRQSPIPAVLLKKPRLVRGTNCTQLGFSVTGRLCPSPLGVPDPWYGQNEVTQYLRSQLDQVICSVRVATSPTAIWHILAGFGYLWRSNTPECN